MSTKVYHAWRTKFDVSLFDVIRDVKPKMTENARDVLRKFIEIELDLMRNEKIDEGEISPMRANNRVVEKYFKQVTEMRRHLYSFCCGFSVHELHGRFYFIPYGEHEFFQGIINVFEGCDLVEDYHYWDNTDCPDDMDPDEWERRSIAWATMCRREEWSNMTAVDIVSHTNFVYISPWLEMSQERVAARAQAEEAENTA